MKSHCIDGARERQLGNRGRLTKELTAGDAIRGVGDYPHSSRRLGTAPTIPKTVNWYNIGLALINLSLLAGLAPEVWPKITSYSRTFALASLKLGGVVLVSAFLVDVAAHALTPGQSPLFALPGGPTSGPVPITPGVLVSGSAGGDLIPLLPTLLLAATRSIWLLAAGILWGSWLGLGAAYLLKLSKRRGAGAGFLASLAWVTPTFLLAAFAQEIQAQVFNLTSLGVSGGYGTASAGQAFWAALILGVRPAAYVFRHARDLFDAESEMDHVRTAVAKGVPWAQVVRKHIMRPVGASLVAGWLGSFRLMVGSLPLVEFFFSYPGLGQRLVLSLGVSYPDQLGHFEPDLAIGFVVAMALIVITLEAFGGLLRGRLDPRLNELAVQVA